MPFKQATWPGLEEREYRIAQGMDAAAALVVDGKLVAAAEQERFSGKKHTGDFPIDAIRFCLPRRASPSMRSTRSRTDSTMLPIAIST